MYLSRERLTQNDKCKFILVTDDLQNSGREVLSALTALVLKENVQVNYLTYDKSPNDLSSVLSKNVKIFDGFSDPFSWNDTPAFDIMSPDVVNNLPTLNSVTIIDSLSTLLVHNGAKSLYRSFHKFLKTNSQLIALLHSDAHSKEDCQLFQMLATTVLEAQYSQENMHHLRCLVKFTGGKVTQKNLVFHINSEFEIVSIKDMPKSTNVQSVIKRPDPTANLTFNLNLNSEEKENRSKLHLPYTKVIKDNTSDIVSTVGFSTDDFYDEDDPDDDLDF